MKRTVQIYKNTDAFEVIGAGTVLGAIIGTAVGGYKFRKYSGANNPLEYPFVGAVTGAFASVACVSWFVTLPAMALFGTGYTVARVLEKQ